MTILHLADLHFHKPWYHWLATEAPPHDLLVIAGDLLDLNHPASHGRQVEWVSDWIRDFGRPLSICSGNHDLVWDSQRNVWWPARWLQELAGPEVWVDGQRAEFDGVSLLNCAATGAPPRQRADIWVVHAPPQGPAVSWRETGHPGGDGNLAYAVRKYGPRLVLCGHVHRPISWYDAFGETLYLNPGREPAARFPNHVLLDLESGLVRRVRGGPGPVEHDVLPAAIGGLVPPPSRPAQPADDLAISLTR